MSWNLNNAPKILHNNASDLSCDRTILLMPPLIVAVFLMILGARFWLISTHGFELPFLDQWDAEALYLYEPYLQGTLSWQDMFQPHNEHRIFFTRLIALALLRLNGQWSTVLQMTVNAGIYAAIGTSLFAFLGRAVAQLPRIALAVVCTLLFALPFGWENTLQGFQSQFYLLTGCALAAIWLLCSSKPWSRSWLFGCLIASCALFTMASGFIACAAVLIVIGLESLRRETSWSDLGRHYWPTILICCALIAIALVMLPFVAEHQTLKADSISTFMTALGPCLAWPLQITVYWSVVNWIPFTILLVGYISRMIPNQCGIRFVLAVGVWVLLQCVATAFGRAYTDPGYISRYMDIFSIGLLVNILCGYFLIVAETGTGKMLRWLHLTITVFWLTGTGIGLALQTNKNLRQELPQRDRQFAVLTHNTTIIYANSGMFNQLELRSVNVPYPDPDRLANILQLPMIRQMLPPSIAPQHKTNVLTALATSIADSGFWLLISGFALFVFGMVSTISPLTKSTPDVNDVDIVHD